jgi:hypothetical protein
LAYLRDRLKRLCIRGILLDVQRVVARDGKKVV